MTRYEELQNAIREANKGVHYLKQDDETFHVEGLCIEIDQLRARAARLTREIEVLRLYCNNDCEAMADDVLKQDAAPNEKGKS